MSDGIEFKMDKSAMRVSRVGDSHSDVEYWLSRPVEERFAAVELMRRMNYGEAACTGRLQRVLEVVRKDWR